MTDYKSVQDLIMKAAMYDGITTAIRPIELIGGCNAIELIFSKNDRRYSVYVDPFNIYPEDAVLHYCKKALRELFMAPYDEIKVDKET